MHARYSKAGLLHRMCVCVCVCVCVCIMYRGHVCEVSVRCVFGVCLYVCVCIAELDLYTDSATGDCILG
jgi:hypothetical protein